MYRYLVEGYSASRSSTYRSLVAYSQKARGLVWMDGWMKITRESSKDEVKDVAESSEGDTYTI